MSSPAKTAPKPLRFERWIRVQCRVKDCEAWTSLFASDRLPDFLVCCVCRVRMALKGFPDKFVEVKRRGINKWAVAAKPTKPAKK